ncbi:hypothetical protein FB451DRAFT_1183597 [Mycena latifolia]|nr:hypothetical protein FB451DRAFT_1183597 [Mycena latifolia]
MISALRATVWFELILHCGDLDGATLVQYGHGSSDMLMEACAKGPTVGFQVQSYFCSRLYVIAQNWYVAAPLWTLYASTYVTTILGDPKGCFTAECGSPERPDPLDIPDGSAGHHRYYLGSRGAAAEAEGSVISKLYTVAVMWTLNARAEIRATCLTDENQGIAATLELHSVELMPPGAAIP